LGAIRFARPAFNTRTKRYPEKVVTPQGLRLIASSPAHQAVEEREPEHHRREL
jgi:hypothetical protein